VSKVCPKCQSKNITKGTSAGKAKGLCAKCGHEWTMRKRKVLKLPKVPAEAHQEPAQADLAPEPSQTPQTEETPSVSEKTDLAALQELLDNPPRLGTFQSGIRFLEAAAIIWPEAKWMDWSTLKATMVHASRNTNTWRKVTEGR